MLYSAPSYQDSRSRDGSYTEGTFLCITLWNQLMFVQLKQDFLGQKAGARIDVDEEQAHSLIRESLADPVTDDPLGPIVAKSMETMLTSLTDTLNETINATLKEFGEAQAKSRRSAIPQIFGEGNQGDPEHTFGRFLLAVATKDYKVLEEMGSEFQPWGRKAALNTQTGTQGGFTVPTAFHDQLLMLTEEMSIVEKRAMKVPMEDAPIVDVPTLDLTTAPVSGETAFFGGLQANWEAEASSTGEEEPTFKQVRLQPRELKGYTLCSNTLLGDTGIGLEAVLKKLFASAVAWHKDRAFLNGDGVGKPLGVVKSGALISVTRSAASAVSLTDIAGIMGRLLPGGTAKSIVWVCHPTVLVKLLTMSATTVGGGNVFIGGQVQGMPKWQLLGYDVEVTDKVPALNTAGDIGLYDFSKYLIGEKQKLEIASSEHVAFRTNQMAWRFVCRVDGRPWLPDGITLSDATNTLSPFVTLAAG